MLHLKARLFKVNLWNDCLENDEDSKLFLSNGSKNALHPISVLYAEGLGVKIKTL